MTSRTVNAPESKQNNALGRTERSDSEKGLPGRRLVEPGRSGRHSLKCAICNHPDRAAIEFDFLNWRNPADLVKSYRFRGLSTIYRHAHATGLFAKRRLNLRFAMERIVERVNEVPVTANAVIRAARAIARINDAGEWNDPPTRLIIERTDSSDNSHRENHKSTREKLATRPRPAPIFDPALLDEPSDSASAELPRIEGKPAPTEVILELTPEFARCREERWRGIEADRQARAAHSVAPGDRSPTTREQDVAPYSSTLPEAAFDQLAPASMAPSPARETRAAIQGQSVASPTSLLPQAAPDKPATACPELSRRSEAEALSLPKGGAKQSPRAAGPPLGSSGSPNPPFPFTPEPLRRWKPRRRF